MESDYGFLHRTLRLAQRGKATTAPNPMVGAVVVRAGEIISTGYHRKRGEPHAEAIALQRAGEAARGAILYCSLEPCCCRAPGKLQPPCTEAIIAAGVARVVIGQLDPNPLVRGAGARLLRAAGIAVEVADPHTGAAFWYRNAPFNTAMALGRPFVHLKAATSLDGCIATADGESRWISGEAARGEVHQLRATYHAVAVGIGTVLADNPRLTARHQRAGTRQPLAVVFDPHLRIPESSLLVTERATELIVISRADTPAATETARRAERLRSLGVRVLAVPGAAATGVGSDSAVPGAAATGVDPQSALRELGKLGVQSLLLEGGARLAGSFVGRGLVDRFTLYLAPMLIGDGLPSLRGTGARPLNEATRFEAIRRRTVGTDWVFDAFRAGWLEQVRAGLDGAAEAVCSPA